MMVSTGSPSLRGVRLLAVHRLDGVVAEIAVGVEAVVLLEALHGLGDGVVIGDVVLVAGNVEALAHGGNALVLHARLEGLAFRHLYLRCFGFLFALVAIGAHVGERLLQRFVLACLRLEAVQRGCDVGRGAEFGENLGRFHRRAVIEHVGGDTAPGDAAVEGVARIGQHSASHLDLGVGERVGFALEFRRRVFRRLEAVTIDLREVIDGRLRLVVRRAIRRPERRVIALLIEGLKRGALALAQAHAVGPGVHRVTQFVGDGAVARRRGGRNGRSWSRLRGRCDHADILGARRRDIGGFGHRHAAGRLVLGKGRVAEGNGKAQCSTGQQVVKTNSAHVIFSRSTGAAAPRLSIPNVPDLAREFSEYPNCRCRIGADCCLFAS